MGEAEKSWTPIAAIALMIVAVAALFGYFWYLSKQPLWKCEGAVKATLVAPSTYKRIAADGDYGVYNIEYDASNYMGVPLRSHGVCTIVNGKASWLDTAAIERGAP